MKVQRDFGHGESFFKKKIKTTGQVSQLRGQRSNTPNSVICTDFLPSKHWSI